MKVRESSFASAAALITGASLVLVAIISYAVLLELQTWIPVLGFIGAGLCAFGMASLRHELRWLLRRRRLEVALFTAGAVIVAGCLGYLSSTFTWRLDLTEAKLHSLSPQTVQLVEGLTKPVHVVFFHDHLMLETRERYELMARHSPRLSVEFHDPSLNPAKARLLGVQFAGTAVMSSEDRVLKVNGSGEEDIANALLRVTQGAKQTICFLDGHNEADPFSMESHDHTESSAGVDHSHGLGEDYVLHDRHGMAKARHALETFNYQVQTLSLTRGDADMETCALLIVAGPKTRLLSREVDLIREFLRAGGDAFFLLDPAIETGLEPVLTEYGIVVGDGLVIDPASHYWTDVSAPAVTRYNNHQITRQLPLTFFPGARSLMPTPVRIPGTTVSPVVNSSPTSYEERDPAQASFDDGIDRPGPLTIMAVANRRPLRDGDATLVELGSETDRERQQLREIVGDSPLQVSGTSRIVVIGDSDFATNSFYHFLGNGKLFLNAVNYVAAQENLIGIDPGRRELPKLSVTNRQIKATFVASMLLVPGCLAIAGLLVWWRAR